MALNPNSVETGYAQRMLEESERDMETILKRVEQEERYRRDRERAYKEERRQERLEEARKKELEMQ
jgi:hypothetical protein